MIKYVLLFVFILNLYFYTDYYASDDLSYLYASKYFFSTNEFKVYLDYEVSQIFSKDLFNLNKNIGMLRYGVTIPAALVYFLSAKSLFAVYLFLISIHIFLVYIVYKFVKELKNENSAVISSLLLGLTPIYYVYAGAFFPDLIQTLYIFIAFYISWKSFSYENKRRYIYMFISGFIFGFSYLTKVSSVIMFIPFFIMYLEFTKLKIKDFILYFTVFCIGFLSLVTIEILINLQVLGEPLPRFTIVKEAKNLYLEKMAMNGVLPLDRLYTAWKKFTNVYPPIYLVLLVSGFTYFLKSLIKGKITLIVFCLWPFLYLTFGSTSLSEYLPPSIQERYYSLVMPWFVIISSLGLLALLDKIKIKFLKKVLFVIFFIGLPLSSVSYNHTKAGLLYRAGQVQAFERSVEYAKENYKYPIVLNSYLSRRMYHVPSSKDKELRKIKEVLKKGEKFIYIMPLQKLHVSDKNHLKIKIKENEHLKETELKRIYPQIRMEQIKDFIGIGSNRTTQRSRGMSIRLIEYKETNDKELFNSKKENLSIYPINKSIKVRKKEDFILIGWLKSKEKELIISTQDNKGYKKVPEGYSFAGEIDLKEKSFKTSAILENLSENELKGKVCLFYYSNKYEGFNCEKFKLKSKESKEIKQITKKIKKTNKLRMRIYFYPEKLKSYQVRINSLKVDYIDE